MDRSPFRLHATYDESISSALDVFRRIEQSGSIELKTESEILALEGDRHLERVSYRDGKVGTVETRDIRHVFVMMGSVPSTEWLKGCVSLDVNGFIETGPDLTEDDLAAAH